MISFNVLKADVCKYGPGVEKTTFLKKSPQNSVDRDPRYSGMQGVKM